ncbi:hypothetical protein EV421DRAFT_1661402, partial [Armillaria borealis]
SSGSFLLSSSPLTSAVSPPMYSTLPISPMKHHYTELLNIEPETEYEQALLEALQESQDIIQQQKLQIRGMQATMVIQNVYVGDSHLQLQEHEERKKRPKKRTRIMGDGMAKLMTGDEFTQCVEEHEQEGIDEQKAKDARVELMEHYKMAIKEWEEREKQR